VSVNKDCLEFVFCLYIASTDRLPCLRDGWWHDGPNHCFSKLFRIL
jgi:hypothetical protein